MRSRTARKSYAEFHGKRSTKTLVARVPNPPKTAFLLGEVVEIVYRRPNENVPYLHKFKRRRPLLVADPKGKRLFFVGGDYRTTSRGIVG